MPNGPARLRADAVLHVGDDLAHEPDVEHHRDEQHGEDGDRLADDDQHDRGVDAVDEERVGAERLLIEQRLHAQVGDRRRRCRSGRPRPRRRGSPA